MNAPKIIDDGKYSSIQQISDQLEAASVSSSTSRKTFKTKLPSGLKQVYITIADEKFFWVTRVDKEEELQKFIEELQQVVENSQVRLEKHLSLPRKK